MLYEDERFEWDCEKDQLNRINHDGISFADASLVFDDPNVVFEKDRIDEFGEERWHALGAAANDLLVVVHAIRKKTNGIEKIRISARHAERIERRRYRLQFE